MSTINPALLIGGCFVPGAAAPVQAFNPTSGQPEGPDFGGASPQDINAACQLAADAFDTYRQTTPEVRAHFLETIATRIVALGDALLERAALETGLPLARLTGERGRTVGQLQLFARVLRQGWWQDAVLEAAQPERAPMSRPDLRRYNVAIGPVVVFGASNFPLAFSVAGGDTAAALAAGCPVIVKAHSAHPGASALVGQAISAAVRECGLPAGVFSMLYGAGNALGEALVSHPAVAAVGFTGSRQGGLALMRLAQARPVPIPVYAEMSSINPVFLFPGALASRGAAVGRSFVESLTQGVGQFCTNPGVVVAVQGEGLEAFVAAASQALGAAPAGTMLTPGIHAAYEHGVRQWAQSSAVQTVAQGTPSDSSCRATPALFRTTAAEFMAHEALGEEVFGPASLLVVCKDEAERLQVAEQLEGQLTATLQIDEADYAAAKPLLRVLERKAGRILVNGFPTGVEVSPAMVHGGPFPASSDARTTSVGSLAIQRFVRPVCYQDMPAALLPDALSDSNPWKLPRLVDGVMG